MRLIAWMQSSLLQTFSGHYRGRDTRHMPQKHGGHTWVIADQVCSLNFLFQHSVLRGVEHYDGQGKAACSVEKQQSAPLPHVEAKGEHTHDDKLSNSYRRNVNYNCSYQCCERNA